MHKGTMIGVVSMVSERAKRNILHTSMNRWIPFTSPQPATNGICNQKIVNGMFTFPVISRVIMQGSYYTNGQAEY